MPESMRPDVCHVVMGFPGARERDAMFVYPLPGHENAWRVPPVSDYLREILARGAKVVAIYGGSSMSKQVEALEAGAQIVVGTPGRVLAHLRQRRQGLNADGVPSSGTPPPPGSGSAPPRARA